MRLAFLILPLVTIGSYAHADFAALQHRVAADAKAGKPIVVEVHVALCEKTIIACGGRGLGDGDSLATNLYWATTGGFRGVFERRDSPWRLIESRDAKSNDADILTTHTLRRTFTTDAGPVEVELRAHAWRGKAITRTFERYVADLRDSDAHVVAYVGHNGLMDLGDSALAKLLAKPPVRARPIGTAAIACASAPYLRRVSDDSRIPLLFTTDLLFASSKALEGTLEAFFTRQSLSAIRTAGAAGYAADQHKPVARMMGTFTNPSDPRWRN